MNLKPKLGPMGVLLRMRHHIGEAVVAGQQWCEAFDAGDEKALQIAGELLAEVGAKVQADTELLGKLTEEKNDGKK